MVLGLVVAVAENEVIGKTGGMPWRLPADLTHFREITTGHPIIMGRTTHETIGKALPGRDNIVITRNAAYKADGCQVVNSLGAAIKLAAELDSGEAYIIGGGNIYTQALPLVQTMYVTEVHATPEGDVRFSYDLSAWTEVSREDHPADEHNQYPYSFLKLTRKT
ncbi:MAG TPA: dihydrofolate reductase [Candidatus Polarisedimenticolaceae bacterium]|nr:dihydrofolate reductase [Candidatus Polarisedimenticolaceae bacterium]